MNKKIEKRNRIIESSIELMYSKGYNGTSVKDVTDAAGIPKGSFYNYFKDKEDYALYAIEYYDIHMASEATNLLTDETKKPLDRIKAFFELGIKVAKANGLNYGCFVGNLTQEMGNVNEVISNAAKAVDEKRVKLVYENLVEALEAGDLNKEVNLKVLSNAIITSWQGAQLRMKMKKNEEALDEFYIVLCEIFLK